MVTWRTGWLGVKVVWNKFAAIIKLTTAVIKLVPLPFKVTLVAVAVKTPVAVKVIEPFTTHDVSFAPFVQR